MKTNISSYIDRDGQPHQCPEARPLPPNYNGGANVHEHPRPALNQGSHTPRFHPARQINHRTYPFTTVPLPNVLVPSTPRTTRTMIPGEGEIAKDQPGESEGSAPKKRKGLRSIRHTYTIAHSDKIETSDEKLKGVDVVRPIASAKWDDTSSLNLT